MHILRILLALFFAVGCAVWLHRRDAVAMAGRRLDPYIDGLPALVTAGGYGLLLAATGRPALSGICLAAGAGLLFLLNRLKEHFFHEPIVFLDFLLLGQVIRYPRFYVPYLFPAPVVAGGAVAGLGLIGVWRLEPPVTAGTRLAVLALLAGGLTAIRFWLSGLLRASGRTRALALLDRLGPTRDAKADFARLGLFASMLGHSLWHVHARGRNGQPGIPPAGPGLPGPWPIRLRQPAPHLVLVQAESFCDIRRHRPETPTDVLANLDRLRATGQGGHFLVPTHGAYTMRTEFSVLTGLGPAQLGTDAFNPYGTAARQPVASLAWTLRANGYRTTCLHPFAANFFRRDRVIPHLGFESFESLPRFAGCPRSGPYVSDAALGRRLLDRLASSTTPQFAFAITIEAHGPWTDTRLDREIRLEAPGALGVYLWHLRHMDALFGDLAAALADCDRPVILCGYGDHVAGLPGVGRPGMPHPTATDWFVWDSRGNGPGHHQDLRPEELTAVLLESLARDTKGKLTLGFGAQRNRKPC